MSFCFYKKTLCIVSLLAAFFGVLLLTGCESAQVDTRPKISAKTVNEAIFEVRSNRGNAKSFKAVGKCRAKFSSGGHRYDEKFSVKLWASPPNRLRFHGDVFFNPRGIDLGTNEKVFWLVINPKEIRSYQWGQWSKTTKFEDMIINPTQLLEAFGLLSDMSDENTILASLHRYDLLVRKDFMGRYKDRVYIDNRSRMISKIEYFDINNEIVLTTELSNYKQITDDFKIPMNIKIISNPKASVEKMVDIEISLRSAEPAEIKDAIFLNRPRTKGFKHISEYTADGFVVDQLR